MGLKTEHLVGYLPHALNMKHTKDVNDSREFKLFAITTENRFGIEFQSEDILKKDYLYFEFGKKHNVYPLLRPHADLIKEIEVDGEKFIPLIKLAQIATLSTGDGNSDKWFINKSGVAEHKTGHLFEITDNYDLICKKSDEWKDFDSISLQMEIFKNLFKWYFDVYNLIRKDLAIDLNIINEFK